MLIPSGGHSTITVFFSGLPAHLSFATPSPPNPATAIAFHPPTPSCWLFLPVTGSHLWKCGRVAEWTEGKTILPSHFMKQGPGRTSGLWAARRQGSSAGPRLRARTPPDPPGPCTPLNVPHSVCGTATLGPSLHCASCARQENFLIALITRTPGKCGHQVVRRRDWRLNS